MSSCDNAAVASCCGNLYKLAVSPCFCHNLTLAVTQSSFSFKKCWLVMSHSDQLKTSQTEGYVRVQAWNFSSEAALQNYTISSSKPKAGNMISLTSFLWWQGHWHKQLLKIYIEPMFFCATCAQFSTLWSKNHMNVLWRSGKNEMHRGITED